MAAWRFRRCPRCRIVNTAGAFELVEAFRPGWGYGAAKRRCPDCGHTAPTMAFAVVAERRPRRG